MEYFGGKVPFGSELLQHNEFGVQFRYLFCDLIGIGIGFLIKAGDSFKLVNHNGEDVFLSETELVHHRHESVLDAFFAVVEGVTGGAVRYMLLASPFDTAGKDSSAIKRAALRTVDATRERIYAIFMCFAVKGLAFTEQCLNGVKDFSCDDAFVCTRCVVLIFLSIIDVLFEWHGGFSVFFSI